MNQPINYDTSNQVNHTGPKKKLKKMLLCFSGGSCICAVLFCVIAIGLSMNLSILDAWLYTVKNKK